MVLSIYSFEHRRKLIIYNSILKISGKLPLAFRSICTKYPQETVHWPNGVYFHEFLFVLDGEGVVKYNGKSYKLKKGCAFYLAPNHPIEYFNIKNLKSAFISTTGAVADSIAKHYVPSNFIYYESLSVEKYVSYLNAIINEYRNRNRNGVLSSLVYSLCVEFFEEQNQTLSKFDEVILYLEKNFSKKITLEELSKIGCMSISKLCSDFKNKFNCTIFEYILNLRLTYARDLLLYNPKAMIKDVAVSCGFNDVSYFDREFKKKFDKTPSCFAKSFI